MNLFESSTAARATLIRINLALLASLVGTLACVDDSVIGEAIDSTKVQPDSHTESSGTPPVAHPTATAQLQPDCTQSDAIMRAPYDAWQAKSNSFGTLVGSEWTGHIDAGPNVTLSIGEDQRATLRVGDAAPPPQRDKGYLCSIPIPSPIPNPDGLCVPNRELYEGGVYPTHGARFEMNRLQFEISRLDPFDAWCQLQIVEQVDSCSFSAIKNATASWAAAGCALDGASVDCAWLNMASSICQCTSELCFSTVSPTTFDATYDPTTDSFDGSLNDSRVRLSRLTSN